MRALMRGSRVGRVFFVIFALLVQFVWFREADPMVPGYIAFMTSVRAILYFAGIFLLTMFPGMSRFFGARVSKSKKQREESAEEQRERECQERIHAMELAEAGPKNMFYGALWCIGGCAVTFFSYQQAAAGGGGGRYVIAYGAIIAGALQFLQGISQSRGR
jgi:hypothetical protein